MPRASSRLTGALVVLVAASLFATLGPLSRLAYERGIESFAFVAWRLGLAAIIVAAFVALTSRGRPLREGFDRGSAVGLGIAIVAGLVMNLTMFAALDRVTVALALLGFYTYPGMVAAIAIVLGREPARRSTFIALGIAFAGMILVVAGGLDPNAGLRADSIGFLLALGSAAAQAVYVTVARAYRTVAADRAMTLILAGGAIGVVVLAAAGGSLHELARPLERPDLLPILLVAGSLGAAVPSVLFLVAIRLLGGTRTGIFMLIEPVVAAVLAALVLGEAIGPLQVIGGSAVLAGAAIVQRGHGSGEREGVPGERRREPDEDGFVAPAPGGP